MRIETIHIDNFRCFKGYDVSLAEKTTVLIGLNGTGKTNLIYALKQGMSFIFSKNQIKGLKPLSVSGDLHVVKFEPLDAYYNSKEKNFDYPIALSYSGLFDIQKIEWKFIKNTQTGSILTTRYLDALTAFLKYYNQNTSKCELPVLAFFSDSYPHNKINIGKYAKSILNMDGALPRNFGYYQWDAETNCAEIWEKRYIKVHNTINDYKNPLYEKKSRLVDLYLFIENDPTNSDYNEWELEARKLGTEINQLEEVSSELKEVTFIDNRIKTFTKVLRKDLNFINTEFEIERVTVDRPKGLDNHQIQFFFSGGKAIYFDLLPQGYKRLLSIVLDIAHRSFILNGDKEPNGIVFIDEVELHLHPSLAQEVLERFRKTFPGIQFIVSTHSPLVISNLKKIDDYGSNKILKLVYENDSFKNIEQDNLYGVDYITSLTEVMDATYRPSTIDKLIDSYAMLKGRKKDTEANIVYGKLKEILQGEPNEFLKEEIEKKINSYQ